MKIPKKIKIGFYEYDVIITDEPIIIDGNSNYSGCVDYVKHVIKIKKDMSLKNQYQTLWHEITHALYEYFELNDEDNIEKIVDCIAKGVCMVLEDNDL